MGRLPLIRVRQAAYRLIGCYLPGLVMLSVVCERRLKREGTLAVLLSPHESRARMGMTGERYTFFPGEA